MRDEAGSSPAATLILVGGMVVLFGIMMGGVSAVLGYERAQHITEQAALEAADAASGRIPGYPCDRAERLADEARLQFATCELDGLVSRVTLRVTLLGFSITTRAKAGPQSSLE